MKSLGDEFDNPEGRFDGYSDDIPDADQVVKQKHVDLRVIRPEAKKVYISMLHLTAMFDMGTLNERRMQDLRGTIDTSTGEQWSKGTITKDPTRNNWPVLEVWCPEGEEVIFYSTLRR